MKKGFELIKARQKASNLKLLKDKGIVLPPLFKLYFSYFQVGKFMEFFKIEKKGIKISKGFFLSSIHSKSNLKIVDTLFNEHQLIREFDCESAYLKIGYIGNESLLVGRKSENLDVLFTHRFNDRVPSDLSFVKLADNIFEYINDLVEVPMKDKSYKDYYKNWGEDFWRVRETKEES